ncbi:MAG: hypothetical protein JRF63_07365 [Deltaproteobacteria bacterium]|nr:hypothetical protein [Deltaproteobacteria bacterium]
MPRTMMVSAAAMVAVLVAAALALAQSQEEWREVADSEGNNLKLEQTYHGTKPGAGNTLPRVEELRGLPGTWVTWPGFIMLPDGSSRVFLQTTKPLEYKRADKKNRVTLKLKGAEVFLKNNRNPLVTIHFNTPVRRGYLTSRGGAVEFVLEMKVSATASIAQFADQDGYHYLFVDFPAGQYPTGGQFGDRPSYSGFGSPGQATDDEIPPQPESESNP